MTKEQRERFCRLRKTVARTIDEYLKEDCGHKSYEGTWELLISFPNFFEDETAEAKPDFYQIKLHCYIVGPGRHYEWSGKNWNDALKKCKKDVYEWCREDGEA